MFSRSYYDTKLWERTSTTQTEARTAKESKRFQESQCRSSEKEVLLEQIDGKQIKQEITQKILHVSFRKQYIDL